MSVIVNSGNTELDSKINEFLEYCDSTSFADEVNELVLKGKYDDLSKIMMTRLTFGTAGLRGHMGPGYAAMNDLVVIQTSQGLSSYLNSIVPAKEKSKGVVIGYDNRHNSKRFADLASVAFILNGFKVYLFSNITPTPFVPYAVKNLNCLAGIMVTASHNPKDENGYKEFCKCSGKVIRNHNGQQALTRKPLAIGRRQLEICSISFQDPQCNQAATEDPPAQQDGVKGEQGVDRINMAVF